MAIPCSTFHSDATFTETLPKLYRFLMTARPAVVTFTNSRNEKRQRRAPQAARTRHKEVAINYQDHNHGAHPATRYAPITLDISTTQPTGDTLMFRHFTRSGNYARWTTILTAAATSYLLVGGLHAAQAETINFDLKPNPDVINCLAQDPSDPPTAHVKVTRGKQNDTLTLDLKGVKPGLAFDMFTVERSRLDANGDKDPAFTNFGLGWYQSDIQANKKGNAHVQIRTILLDQIFGLDQDVPSLDATSPETTHHTFHVGFWFNNPADAAECGFTGHTPFNGEQNAGPLAMISVPDAPTGLGPLCANPDLSHPGTCNP
jgi:hypothetical protein